MTWQPPKHLHGAIAERNGMTEAEFEKLAKKKPRKPAQPSQLEALLAFQIATLVRAPAPEREQQLVPGRKFRCDFVWRDERLVVEVEGGTKMQGRHNRAEGFEIDAEKYNLLTIAGWRVLRFTARQVCAGLAVKQIEEALQIVGIQR